MINQLKQLQAQASIYNLECILVGGFVRDKVIFSNKSTDIDVEIHPLEENKNVDIFLDQFVKFAKQLNGKKLPFSIYKFPFENFSVEVSPPRIESFRPDDFSHDNFSIEVSTSRNFKKLWERRDFTINSIGISLLNDKVIDPFDGVTDGENRILRPCGKDFYNDYVRFLRGIRFKLLFDYELGFDPSNFVLKNMSLYHYINEGLKSKDFARYLKEFKKMSDEASVDKQISRLNYLLSCDFKNNPKISSVNELEFFLSNSENLEEILSILSPYGIVSKKRILKLKKQV